MSTKLFEENGSLTPEGSQLVKPLADSLDALLKSSEVSNLGVAQIRTLGSYLAKMVGDSICRRLDYK